MKFVNCIAHVLTIVGGLNWGLVGLFKYNLVTSLLGEASAATTTVYVLVGLSALYSLFLLKRTCTDCCTAKAQG